MPPSDYDQGPAPSTEPCPACDSAAERLFEWSPSWAEFERAHDALIAHCLAEHARQPEGGGT